MQLQSRQLVDQLSFKGKYFWPSFPVILVTLMFTLLVSRKLKDQIHGSLKPFTNKAKKASKQKKSLSTRQKKNGTALDSLISAGQTLKNRISGSFQSVANKTKKAIKQNKTGSQTRQQIKKTTPASKTQKSAPRAKKATKPAASNTYQSNKSRPPVNKQRVDDDGNMFSVLCHLSSLFGLGIILPLIVC